MGTAAFGVKSHQMCTQINQCQRAVLTLSEGESMRDGGKRARMLTAFKTPMGILCHCILSPPLLASAISQHSVCVCLSPSLSERISHPLLLQLLAASLLIPPSVPFSLCLSSYISTAILHPTFSFYPIPPCFLSALSCLFQC